MWCKNCGKIIAQQLCSFSLTVILCIISYYYDLRSQATPKTCLLIQDHNCLVTTPFLSVRDDIHLWYALWLSCWTVFLKFLCMYQQNYAFDCSTRVHKSSFRALNHLALACTPSSLLSSGLDSDFRYRVTNQLFQLIFWNNYMVSQLECYPMKTRPSS